ncbi:penicillin acylase family protein [Paenisporosarcina cavernae]|uniref:Penicillin acylase family protein n=1 Tax=Paenisporosarcina cavernae TaxID=2320858 RepID=A0A385YUN4_9BACL|nr:penicillin acylase family protein [Paenisporosarcina cavernae]AYC30396.1 penicillin acylase family protein [Paenisporosarcina cavernae]
MRKKRRIGKILLWTLGTLALLILAVAIGLNWFIGKSKPQISGELHVDMLEEEVSVERDEKGVPHITAKSEADLYRAQGFVQAQDRLFQMDLARRQASGTLSEVVGDAAVSTDKFFRTFSLRDAAEKSWAGYGSEAKQVLEWYAEGVNAYITYAKEENKLSYEFSLLGYEPSDWDTIDSLTIGKYMAYDLGGNWSSLAVRHWALGNLPEAKAKELFITYPEDKPSIIQANLDNQVKVANAFDASLLPNEFNGSNNWVVSGEKTASGKPLLADDPHLGLSTPSIWYQMHLSSPEQNVSGVIFAGVPGIILGHNESIAWGVTNVGPDVQDLYIEKPNPSTKYEYEYDGKWEKAEVRDEPIRVKDGDTVDFEVVVTRHGPIISDVMYDNTESEAVFSMQWTALEPTLELQAVLNMNKATNWEEFETALEDFHAPAQNFVFASTDGTIAYKANGRIPIRKQGDAQLPVPGNSSDYGWKGYVPYDELPRVVNPKEGFIATANNEVVDDSYPYHITDFWAQSYRYERISEVLQAGDSFKKEDMMALQMDTQDLLAREFVQDMVATVRKSDRADHLEKYVTILDDWDQNDSKDSAAPLIFHRWIKQLPITLFAPEMPEDVYDLLQGKGNITDQMLRDAFAGNEGEWVKQYGGLDKWLADSLEESMKNVAEEFGEDPKDWKWGEYHQLTFDHPLGGASPVLGYLLNAKSVPVSGSNITVMAAGFDEDGRVDHGASWRYVVDLADTSKAYHIVGPGQSGHIKSKWFHDQVQDWAKGDYHVTSIDGNETQEMEKLQLLPGQ